MTPLRLFKTLAITEAVTWAALLTGMVFKYAVVKDPIGVQVAGPIHGVAFIAYCLATIVIGIDQGWSRRRVLLGLASSIPPFFTILFERYAESRGLLGTSWQSRADSPTRGQRAVCWLLRNRLRALAAFAGAVVALTAVALIAGPPVGG
jgi:integral membrane protein